MKNKITIEAAVANHSEEMDVRNLGLLSVAEIKNGRYSKRQMTSIKCKLIKFAAVFFAVLCMAHKARADDAITIRDYINGKHPTGDLVATYSLSYNTVTVTGTVGAAPSTSDYLTLNIDYGVTVIWEANLSGTPSGNYALINISGGLGTFEIRSGTIENTGTGRAITNNSTCVIKVLDGARIASSNTSYNTPSTIYLADSGTATDARLVINGGTVENTANGGYAVYNASTGAINVSGGTVNAAYAIYNYNSTYSSSTGSVTVSGGTISTGTGRAIYNSGGTVTVSGGTVSATNGEAIYNYSTSYYDSSSSTVNITGGTVSATTGNAIYTSSGTVNILEGAKVTSANTTSNGGTIINSGTLNINGGTVDNTSSGTNANAIYNSGSTLNVSDGIVKSENGNAIHSYWSGTVNISGGTILTNGSGKAAISSDNYSTKTVRITGGTVEATQSNSYAVYGESNPTLILGGNPIITGRIFTFPEKFSVLTDGDDIFAPGQTYVLDYPAAQYVVSKIAVTDGWNYLDHFSLYNPDYALITSSTHLAIAAAYRVTFNLNGGTGTLPANVSIPQGYYIKVKPPTSEYSRPGYTSDGEWWYGSPAGAAVFVFGEGGTPVLQNTTLFLMWSPVTYLITYHLDGGINHLSNPANYTAESDDIILQSPAKDGYAFGGWFDSNTYENQVTSIPLGSSENRTLWAKWMPFYTITFDATGGTVIPATSLTGDFGKLASLPYPVRNNDIFNGWFTAATGGDEVSESTEFSADATIFAQWTPVYTVTFDANGGTVDSPSGTTGADMTLAYLPVPVRNGYIFNSWFTASSGGELVLESTVFSANTTIYAQWTLITFTITFNANGGVVSPASDTTGEGWTLPSLPVPSRNGHVFIGWFTAITDGTEITVNTVFVANATIYAQWTPVYTVTFNANGGTVTPSSGLTGADRTLAFLPVPIRNGYTFNGWFTTATGGVEVTENTVFSANTTIFAQWIQITSTPEIEPTKLLRAWQHNGLLHVTGITPGETLSIYSLSGALVYQNVATSDETDISLKVKGVYILKAGDKTIKVTFE